VAVGYGADVRAAVAVLLLAVATARAGTPRWDPRAWADEGTVELRTTAPGEGPHWFPVWLVVIDGQLYVRLGTRAAGRIASNVTAPDVGARIGGVEFDRVRGEPAPELATRVGAAMARKYWSDILVRHVNHPLVLRLVPETDSTR